MKDRFDKPHIDQKLNALAKARPFHNLKELIKNKQDILRYLSLDDEEFIAFIIAVKAFHPELDQDDIFQTKDMIPKIINFKTAKFPELAIEIAKLKTHYADKIIDDLRLKHTKQIDFGNQDILPSAEQLNKKRVNIPKTITKANEHTQIKKRVANADILKDDIARDILIGLKKEIENNKNWKVSYGGGIVVQGLNHNNPVPDTVAHIYQYIQSALDRGDYWQNILRELKPHMHTAEKKSKGWNFFWMRDKETINFYKNFHQKVRNLENLLGTVDSKLALKNSHASHHNHHE